MEFVRVFVSYSGRIGGVAIVCVGLGALLEGFGLLLLIPILAVVLDSGRKASWLAATAAQFFTRVGAETRFQKLALMLSLFAALMLVRAVVMSVRDVSLAELQIGFAAEMRSIVTKRLAAARWDVVAKLRHARIANLIGSDILSIAGAANFLLQCTVSLTVLVSQCILAVFLSPVLASLALILLAVGGLALGSVMRRAREHGRFVVNSNLSLTNSTAQFLGAIKLAVGMNLQDSFVAEFQSTLLNLTNRQVAYARQRTNAHLAVTTLSALVAALAVLIGFGIMNVAPSILIAVLFLLARMIGPASQILQGAQQFAINLPAFEKFKILEQELAAAQDETAEAICDFPGGSIVFRSVSFTYTGANENSGSTPVLYNVDVTITSGSFAGISGASGAGKTTFADLLVGLFPAQSGEISVGGIVLDGAARNAWRNHVSYVPQDPFLFHDTIRRNLLWAAPGASDDALWSALRLVGADDLVRKMAQGLDTVVGERGVLISGGERQRLALARAMLRQPRLLVLDEATNAIDITSERQILSRLIALNPRPTIVMIAHRSESLSLCERILVLAEGRFAES